MQEREPQRGTLQDKPQGVSVTHQFTQLAAITWVNITLLHFSLSGLRVGYCCLPSPCLVSRNQQLPRSLLLCSSPLSHASPHSSSSQLPLLSFLPFPFSFCALFSSLFLPPHLLQHVHESPSLPSRRASKFLIRSWLTSQNTTSTYCSCQYPNNFIPTPPCPAPLSREAHYLISQQQAAHLHPFTNSTCQS